MATCLFVCSSDNTLDVFASVFARFHEVWPARGLPAFLGTTTRESPIRGFEAVRAGAPAGWRAETAAQISSLPEAFGAIVLLLDDFLVTAADDGAVREAAASVEAGTFDYVRLVPPARSMWIAGLHALTPRPGAAQPLSPREPYFSSLQAAVWSRAHLLRSLAAPGSIWDFEHVRLAGARHAALARPALRYRHVVEKGEWLADAPAAFGRAGLVFEPGARPVLSGAKGWEMTARKAAFAVFGYALARARRKIP